ncbi:Site-specific recombinase XerD [Microbacterium testaceum StLB037]|uniref:Site-specific recombinase XerD n=1 Tax=Microbacterium testaceum (strain StLB037) TaxID=979556 RepID=A0A1H0PRY2_MICTS|nr:tyrosine-type recombinase/integrase [Microbacterium testaceum]SDP07415.1 Site-specific recombinase XerD [Microbacterium testaceum StLB037]
MRVTEEWGDAIEAFLLGQVAAGKAASSRKSWAQHLGHLAKNVYTGPWAVTTDDVAGYMASMNWAQETRRGRRNTFEAFYAWAVATGRTPSSPVDHIARVKPSDPRPRPVPDSIYLAALARADEDERLWIDLAAEHGLRRAEVAVIGSRDIVPTLLGHDLIVHSKGGKVREVPLTRAMAEALLARAEEQGKGYLFRGEDDGHVSPQWVGKRVARLLGDPWTMHKLRHRAATRFWVAAEGDAYVVADLMGWANINMVKVYVYLPNDRKRAIVEGASRVGARLAPVT